METHNTSPTHCRHTYDHMVRLTDDFASGAARVDEPLPGGELWREAAADEGVQNAVTAVRHHRGVACQLVSLQGCKKHIQN